MFIVLRADVEINNHVFFNVFLFLKVYHLFCLIIETFLFVAYTTKINN